MKTKWIGIIIIVLYVLALPYFYFSAKKQIISLIGERSIAIGRLAEAKINNHIQDYIAYIDELQIKMADADYDAVKETATRWADPADVYSVLSKELHDIKSSFPAVKYLYTCDVVEGENPHFIMLLDSNLPSTTDHSPVGSIEEGVNSFSFKAFHEQSIMADREFYHYGDWGNLLTTYVPIKYQGKFYHSIGVDIDYTQVAPFINLLKLWVVASLILCFYFGFILYRK